MSTQSYYPCFIFIFAQQILIKEFYAGCISNTIISLNNATNSIPQLMSINHIYKNPQSPQFDLTSFTFDQPVKSLKIGFIHSENGTDMMDFYFMGITNVNIEKIDFKLSNCQVYTRNVFRFDTIQSLKVNDVYIRDCQHPIEGNLFKFIDVINVTLNQLQVEDISFYSNLISISGANKFILKEINIQNCFYSTKLIKIRKTTSTKIIDSQIHLNYKSKLVHDLSLIESKSIMNDSIQQKISQQQNQTDGSWITVYDQNDGSKSLITFLDFRSSDTQSNLPYCLQIINTQVDLGGYNSRFLFISQPFLPIQILNSTFSNMQVHQNGGCLKFDQVIQVFIQSSNFINCQSDKFGGAIFGYGISILNISNSIIQDSQALFGGGIALQVSQLYQSNLILKNNNSTYLDPDINDLKPIFKINKIVEYVKFEIQKEYLIKDIEMKPTIQLIPGSLYLFIMDFAFIKNKQQKNQIFQLEESSDQIEKDNEYYIQDGIFTGNVYDYAFKKSTQQEVNESSMYLNSEIQIPQSKEKPYLLFQPNSQMQDNYDLKFFYQIELLKSVKFSLRDCIQGQQKIEINSAANNQFICQYCGHMSANYDNTTFECQPCDGQIFSKCYLNYTELNSGFWRDNLTVAKNEIYKCSNNQQGTCVGGSGVGNSLCSEGRIGVECSTCDENKQYWNATYTASGLYSCTKCESISYNMVKIILVLVAFIVILFFLIYSNFKKIKNIIFQYYLSKMQLIYIGTSFTKFGLASVYVKILSFNTSILYFIQSQLEFNLSSSVIERSIQYSNPLQASFASVNCALYELFPEKTNQGIIRLKFYLILPIVIIPLALIFPTIRFLLKKSSGRFFRYNISLTIIYTLFIVFYNQILSTTLDSLLCRSFGNGKKFLLIDLSTPCSSSTEYYQYSISGLIVYSLLVPSFLIFSLIKNRNKLKKLQILFQYGFLYQEYKDKFYYWEIIRFLVRVSYLIIQKLFFQHNEFMNCLNIFCLIIYQFLLQKFQPFKRNPLNKMEMISVIIVMSSFIALIIYQTQNNNSQNSLGILPDIIMYFCLLSALIFNAYICILILISFTESTFIKLCSQSKFSCILRCLPQFEKSVNTERVHKNFKILRKIVKNIVIYKQNSQESFYTEIKSIEL